MATDLVVRQLNMTPHVLKLPLPLAIPVVVQGPNMSIAVYTKGAAPASFLSGRSPMICLLI